MTSLALVERTFETDARDGREYPCILGIAQDHKLTARHLDRQNFFHEGLIAARSVP